MKERAMKERAKKKPTPPIGRKDLQDPDRDVSDPRERPDEREPERSDRDPGAGRPVQLDEAGQPRRRGDESPRRPTDDASPAK